MGDWSLDIKDMSWVENTKGEVDFIIESLQLHGKERILDLACGFGRHSLELSRRGYSVVGVDITTTFISDAQATALKEHLDAEFIQSDVLNLHFLNEFDVVLNMADGAIGYFDTEAENLKLFDIISQALREGGKHLMGICSADHAQKYFPKRHWEAGNQSLSLADFTWNNEKSRMIYKNHVFLFGHELEKISDSFPKDDDNGIRLYTRKELKFILNQRGLEVINIYGAYDTKIPASDDQIMQVVCSTKTVKSNTAKQ
jgi:SAM-dependent methyltransferase